MKKNSFEFKSRAGFTLIELVMVIVILGALAAVVLPKFIDLSNEARDAQFRTIRDVIVSASYNNSVLKKAGTGSAVVIDGLVCSNAVVETLLGAPLPKNIFLSQKGNLVTNTCQGNSQLRASCFLNDKENSSDGAYALPIYCAR